jgi:hypothetical protein
VRLLLVAASVVPSSLILVTLMKEALSSSETSVLIRSTLLNILEDAVLQPTKQTYKQVGKERDMIGNNNYNTEEIRIDLINNNYYYNHNFFNEQC